MMAAEFKMRSHLELLKTLEGHIIDSVEIEYRDGQAHVEVSGHTGGPDYETLNTKTVSFSIHLKRVFETLGVEEALEDGGYKADAQRMCTKLRAIEAWFESEVEGYPDLYKKLKGLAKLLGKEAS